MVEDPTDLYRIQVYYDEDIFNFNKLNKAIKNEVERINGLTDKCGRKCYQVYIINEPLNAAGIRALPWGTCSRAILMAHTGFISNKKYIIDTRIIENGKNIMINSSELSPNVEVYGCHLSGQPNGKVNQHDLLKMIVDKLKNIRSKDACIEIEYIMLASAVMNMENLE